MNGLASEGIVNILVLFSMISRISNVEILQRDYLPLKHNNNINKEKPLQKPKCTFSSIQDSLVARRRSANDQWMLENFRHAQQITMQDLTDLNRNELLSRETPIHAEKKSPQSRFLEKATPPLQLQPTVLPKHELDYIEQALKQDEQRIIRQRRILEQQQMWQRRQQLIEEQQLQRQQERLIYLHLALQERRDALKRQLGVQQEKIEAEKRKRYLQAQHSIFEKLKETHRHLLGNLKLLSNESYKIDVFKTHLQRTYNCLNKLLISVSNLQGLYFAYRFGPDFVTDSECDLIAGRDQIYTTPKIVPEIKFESNNATNASATNSSSSINSKHDSIILISKNVSVNNSSEHSTNSNLTNLSNDGSSNNVLSFVTDSNSDVAIAEDGTANNAINLNNVNKGNVVNSNSNFNSNDESASNGSGVEDDDNNDNDSRLFKSGRDSSTVEEMREARISEIFEKRN